MSVNYASGLSHYEHKGKCGMPETFDSTELVNEKVSELIELFKSSQHAVVITGAGISTSAGIPDFRGPKGVWTLEQRGEAPSLSVTFDTARPTYTHLALVALEEAGYVKCVISQNVDGLHMRSGFPRDRLAELHGNMFVEQCNKCNSQYVRQNMVPTMALRPTGNNCTEIKRRGNCRGQLHDTILDWEDSLPDRDLDMAEEHCKKSDLCFCLGTSLQILPCGRMPILTKKNGGQIAIVSLQTTKQDKQANIKIHCYVDEVMRKLCDGLGVVIPHWDGPIVRLKSRHKVPRQWLPKVVVADCLTDDKETLKSKSETESETGKITDKKLPGITNSLSQNGSELSVVTKKETSPEMENSMKVEAGSQNICSNESNHNSQKPNSSVKVEPTGMMSIQNGTECDNVAHTSKPEKSMVNHITKYIDQNIGIKADSTESSQSPFGTSTCSTDENGKQIYVDQSSENYSSNVRQIQDLSEASQESSKLDAEEIQSKRMRVE